MTATPCLLLPKQTLDEARAARALKAAAAFEWAKNNPNPSCKWKGFHQTSQYGNWCSQCGSFDLPPPHFYPAKKSAEIIEHPKNAELEINYAWCRL